MANAVVEVWQNGQYLTQTTASICGYYTVSLSPGDYTLKVNGTYDSRKAGDCSTTIQTNKSFAGENDGDVDSSSWTVLHILTY